MPIRPSKGTRQLNADLSADLVERFRAFVEGRGEKLREHLEMALERHLANPPPPLRPPPAPPLPPVVPEPAGSKKPRKK